MPAESSRDYTQQETVNLTPIPCWQHLTAAAYCSQIRAVTDQITTEAEAERAQTGKQPLGVEAVLRQKPGTRPEKVIRDDRMSHLGSIMNLSYQTWEESYEETR